MNQTSPAPLPPTSEKLTAALRSLVAAALLTGLKIAVGMLSGSLGILSEAAHSGIDFVAAALTFFSVHVADKPADSSHPFGHGKVEHLSAFVQTALLLVTCAWIIFEAVRRLFFRHVHVEPSLGAFAVMFVSISVDTLRSRDLFRVARKHNSQALEADALHFSTDVYSSTVVVVGLALVYVARQSGIAWLLYADSFAAVVVAGISIHIVMRLGKRSFDALVDAAPESTQAEIAGAVAQVPGVLTQDRIRVRQSGRDLFVDLRLTLASNIPFEHAESVVDLVESKVHELFPLADVVIHAAPRKPPTTDLVENIRSVAHQHNFPVHDLIAYEVNGHINVSLDLEVEPALTLRDAHDQATTLERAILDEVPGVGEVNIHIEPLLRKVETANSPEWPRQGMEDRILRIARDTPELLDVHSVEAHQVGASVLVSLHCTLEADLPIARVHAVTEDLEFRCREAFPRISKVNIHAEPKE